MIDIRINGESLDLSPKTRIRFEVNSPLFSWDKTPGTFSYPITLPPTGKNKRLLKFSHRISGIGNKVVRESCSVFLAGLHFIDGYLKVRLSSGVSGFNAAVIAGAGDFANLNEDKQLPDLILGGDRLIAPAQQDFIPHLNSTLIGGYPANDYVFFPYNNDFFPTPHDGSNPIWKNTVNYYTNGTFANNVLAGFGLDYLMATPFIYVMYLLDEIFGEAGYTFLPGPFKNDAEMQSLALFNTEAISNYTIFPAPTYPSHWDFSKSLPRYPVAGFLNQLRTMFNLGIFFSHKDRQVRIIPLKDVLNSSMVDDWTAYALAGAAVEDQDASDLGFEFDLESKDSMTEDDIQPLTGLNEIPPVISNSDLVVLSPSAGDVTLVLDTQQWWTYDGTQWLFHSYNLLGSTEGNEPSVLNSGISTFQQVAATDDQTPGRDWLLPKTLLPGTYQAQNYIPGAMEEYKPRLLFYRGLRPDSNQDNYPLGSSSVYDFQGNQVGNYSLDWNSPFGLKEVWWKDWISFLKNTRKQSFKLTLPPHTLKDFGMERPVLINGVKYLKGKASVVVTMKKVMPTQIELYKI